MATKAPVLQGMCSGCVCNEPGRASGGHSGDELVEKISRYDVFIIRGNVSNIAVGASIIVSNKVHDK